MPSPNSLGGWTGTPLYSVALDRFTQLTFDTGGGDDLIVLDAAGGALPKGLSFDLGARGNTLLVKGGAYSFATTVLPSSPTTSMVLRDGAAATFASTIRLASLDIGANSKETLSAGYKSLVAGGQSVDANSILIRYTCYGDANLDGSSRLPTPWRSRPTTDARTERGTRPISTMTAR